MIQNGHTTTNAYKKLLLYHNHCHRRSFFFAKGKTQTLFYIRDHIWVIAECKIADSCNFQDIPFLVKSFICGVVMFFLVAVMLLYQMNTKHGWKWWLQTLNTTFIIIFLQEHVLKLQFCNIIPCVMHKS